MPNEYYEAAKEYLSYGFNPIPLREKSKKPAISWQVYQDERILPTTIDAWNQEGLWNGVAIICGSISSIVVIDCDSKEIYEKVRSLAPDTWVVESGSGRSWHFYAAADYGIETRRINTPWGHIDIQGQGTYVVAPPSLHEKTSLPYKLNKASSQIAEFREFERVFNFLRPYINSGKRRIRDLVKGPITAGSRNDSAIRYAGYLNHVVGLDPQTILFELKRWNQTVCDPPLSDAEIESVWKSALRYGTKEIGREII
ncbi:MAG: bifunctional DNA primase/polymerase [Thaumarchaeota archaeon]|nr:bifunctional DNA primase/polymerase [Nitrososphaerota archaeon]